MANPYTRQSSFSDGDTINSALFNNEYNALVLAFSSTVGHTHDGSTGEGAPVTVIGPAQDLVVASASILPKTNNTVDLGSSTYKFKDGYFAGNVTVDGVVTHSGNMIIGDSATDTLTINATIQGSSLVFEGATANAYEMTLAIPDVSADRTITFPNATDTLVGKATTDTLTNKTLTSAVLNTGVSGTAILDEDNMATNSATQLATQQSIKAYVDTAILTEDTLAELNDTNITSAADASLLLYDTGTSTWRDAAMSGDATIGDTGVITIANDAIDSQHYAADSIDSEHYAAGSVDATALGADSVTAAKIGDNVLDSEHYAAGSIDNEHLADDAVDSDEIAAGAIDLAHMSVNSIDSAQYVDGSIDLAHMSANSVDSNQYVDGSIDTAHYAAGSVDTTALGADSVTTAKIADNVTLGGNVTVSGNFTVSGDTTTVNTATLAVEDPLISLATGNNGADAVDIGIYGLYDTSGSQDLYGGLFRDASDSGKWKLFKDNQVAPATTVDVSGTGYVVGTLVATIEGNITGNVTGNTSGTAATVTGGTQASITSAANLVTVGTIGTGVWQGTAVASGYIAADAITGAKIADDAIDSEHIVADSIDSEHYAAGSVDATALGADCVTAAKIGDNVINSEHYAADSIDAEHLAPNSVNTDAIVDGSVRTVHLAADSITAAKIGDNIINSEHYAAASIDNEHLADNAVGTAEIAADAVTYAKIQNVTATDRILGRDSAGAGIVEEISPSSVRTMINVADGANAYTLPTATSSTYGGIRVALSGTHLTITA
jgi:hypothetical protein